MQFLNRKGSDFHYIKRTILIMLSKL